jgi:hypothetical protein
MHAIAEFIVGGFFSALGWWGANHYVIEPHLDSKPVTIEKKQEKEDDKPERKDTGMVVPEKS